MVKGEAHRNTSGGILVDHYAPVFKSKLLLNKVKENLYATHLRPVVLYACSTWVTTAGDEKRLNIFERKVSKKIDGLVYNPDTRSLEAKDKRTADTIV